MALTVSTQVVGGRSPLLDEFSVPPPVHLSGGDGDTLLRDLIEHVVQHELKQYGDRQESLRFDRVLTSRQIDEASLRGKVNPAARDHDVAAVDSEHSVATALQAFEDGLFLVLIDGVERRSLDEVVRIQRDSALVFVRLVFLAGG